MMINLPIFIRLTGLDGKNLYLNVYWINQLSDEESGTELFMIYTDETIHVKETSKQIFKEIGLGIAKQKKRLEENLEWLESLAKEGGE